jgi:serine/threonine-protein kinase
VSRAIAGLEGLVASVADGWPQDWDALEATVEDDRTRRALKNLRVVAAIAEFHRSSAGGGRAARRVPGGTESMKETPLRLGGKPSSREARPLGDTWGRFVLRRRLGQGAFGDVYDAYDPQLDRDVALKLLKPLAFSPGHARSLLNEARMLAQVRHPNVASVYGADQHAGRAGLWMELIRGLTLEELLRSHGPMSGGEAALVGQDVCRALAAVHRAGLVHRDLKAANVIREVGGRIVLTDFGTGRFRARATKRDVVGTLPYIAPEVMAGSPATELSDLYSLGVLLFRLVTGAYPTERSGSELPVQGQHRGEVASLRDLRPDLSEPFVSAVEEALAPDPSRRPPSAGVMRAGLGLVLGASASSRA